MVKKKINFNLTNLYYLALLKETKEFVKHLDPNLLWVQKPRQRGCIAGEELGVSSNFRFTFNRASPLGER